jgi:DNA repair protein RadA
MATHLGLDPNQVVKNIIYAEAYTSDHQMFLLDNADEIVKKNNVKLIIIDSLTSHFRSEYLGREMLASRQQKLNKHMHKLIRLARAFNTVRRSSRGPVRIARLVSSPYLPEGEEIFKITENGIEDVSEEEKPRSRGR